MSFTQKSSYFKPLAVTKRDAFGLIGSPRLVQRWLFHRWVLVVRAGGRGCETLIDYQSLVAAYDRYVRGDEPPLLPSEQRAAVAATGQSGSNGGARQ